MKNILIYSTRQCPYCSNAKSLLTARGLAYDEVDVSEDLKLRERMVQRSGNRTVPQIFINGEAIGGFNELAQLDAAGLLA